MKRPLATCASALTALVLLVGCPPPEPEMPDPNLTDVECDMPGQTRCADGITWQTCDSSGFWYSEDVCGSSEVCSLQLGCVACEPLMGRLCVADEVHTCNSDGTIGGTVETCTAGACEYGHCIDEDCPDGTDLIYVVDTAYNLLQFDPREDAFTFELLGDLSCPASSAWPGWGAGGSATPFSMSVDRNGVAWILYSSGEIFHVPVDNVDACQISMFEPGTEGFELFGMGFVSDAAGSDQETLYIAGGTVEQMQIHATGRLASIHPETIQLAPIGYLSPSELGPELTGTGAGELFAYFPGVGSATVARVDKTTGLNIEEWAIPPLPGQLRAWAFAHYADQFFIFVTFEDPMEGQISQVRRFDRATGVTDIVLTDTPYRIVGAGVSTCAPFVLE